MVGKASRAKKIAVIQDKTIINSLVDQINAYPSDTVLFVGASSIELISRVYDNALKVIVIEEDINLVNKLQRVMITNQKQSKLKVINSNFEQSIFPCFTIGVINAPFSLVTPILMKFLLHKEPFRYIYLLSSEEMAKSIAAQPGNDHFTRLSVNMQLFCKTSEAKKIKGASLTPPTKNNIILLRVQKRKGIQNIDEMMDFKQWDDMVRILFNRKNKTLFSLLKYL